MIDVRCVCKSVNYYRKCSDYIYSVKWLHSALIHIHSSVVHVYKFVCVCVLYGQSVFLFHWLNYFVFDMYKVYS